MRTQIRSVAAAVALLAAAALPQAARAVDTGDANFSKYVSLGDSLTAGFCSGSIISTCQLNSYPALIYQQATGQPASNFQQPLVSPPGLPNVLYLKSLVPVPVIAPTPGNPGQPLNLNLPRPYDNMAIPGANLHDLLTKTQSTSANDPTDLILRRLGFTQLQQGLSLHPTFVTMWIGNNDALGAATSGTAIEGVTLTPPTQFDQEYRAAVAGILGTGAKLAVATIPDVTAIPFVTTISPYIVNPATNQPVLVNGSPITYIGVSPGDYVLLTASDKIKQGYGIPLQLGGNGQPLPGEVVLTAAEDQTIHNYVVAYNNTIRSVAASNANIALVDTNADFNEIKDRGLSIGGVTFTSKFLLGGLFSYDGVHPTSFGYAYIANLFIDAINAKFNGSIPEVDLYGFMFGTKSMFAPDLAPFYFTPEAFKNLQVAFPAPKAQPRHPRRGHH